MILSFDDYAFEENSYSKKGKGDGIRTVKYALPKNYDLFFKERGICPSCNQKAKLVHDIYDIRNALTADIFQEKIWECQVCGWWEAEDYFMSDEDLLDDDYNLYKETKLYHSIVKGFNISDLNIPLTTLLNELQKDTKGLYEIHPNKMEELSGYVLASFFDCDVKYVGKSGDGGKDLILIFKDDPILVQVKRRSKENSVESISTIRDLLGTLFIENSRKGMVVSTANHFSKKSLEVKTDLLEENKLDYFELIDFKRFIEMLNLIRVSNTKPWEKLLENGYFKK